MTKEITLAEVKAAYAKFPNVMPIKNGFYRPESIKGPVCACPLGILALAANQPVSNDNFSVKCWAEDVFGEVYANDFWKGVDNRWQGQLEMLGQLEITKPGYVRGREIAIALGLDRD